MKHIAIFFIKIYQKIPGSFHDMCRFYPTCSNYAIEALEEYGFFKGSIMTFKRILKCNPLHEGGYDPVPKKEKKYEKDN